MACPSFEKIELPLPKSPRKHMASTLQNQMAIDIEADATVGSIYLLFNHQWMPA